MNQSVIFKGLLVLVIVMMFAVPGISYAEEWPPNNSSSDNGSITLQNGEVLNSTEVNHLQIMLHIYKENGMGREADIVERMLAGKLNYWEVKQLNNSKIKGFPGFIDTDEHYISASHVLFTTVQRNWWMLGQNEHSGWSGNPGTGADHPIDEIWMVAKAWESSGTLSYSSSFGFSPASYVYCRNDGPSSGRARSEVTYQDGSAHYTGVADGTY